MISVTNTCLCAKINVHTLENESYFPSTELPEVEIVEETVSDGDVDIETLVCVVSGFGVVRAVVETAISVKWKKMSFFRAISFFMRLLGGTKIQLKSFTTGSVVHHCSARRKLWNIDTLNGSKRKKRAVNSME